MVEVELPEPPSMPGFFIARARLRAALRATCLVLLASSLPPADAFQSGEPAPAPVSPVDAAKQDAAKQDAAKQDAAKQDAAKQDAAKPDAAMPDAAMPDAAKQDAAKQDAAKPDAAKQDAAKPEDPERGLIDPVDGWFDLSPFLEHAAGFVPLIVPITEPALGYGAVFAAVFLDPREEAGSEGWSRPNISLLGGLATEDGSEGLFAANSSLWGDGDVQTLIGVGKMALELSLYGVGNDPPVADDPLDYGLDAEGFVGEVRRRFGDSKWWGGLRLVYARSEVDFEDPRGDVAGAGAADEGVTLAGSALTLRYDSLDNFFTPTSGTLWDTNLSLFDEALGGSRDFQLFTEILIHHWTLAPDFFLGARGQFDASFGDTPFYVRPYIQLRGIPALRYQGEEVASIELELRWRFHPRLSAVGFGGIGWAWTDFEEVDRSQNASAGGVGMRYMIAREFGLHAGLDVAYGPEEGAVYVQFGNAWLRP